MPNWVILLIVTAIVILAWTWSKQRASSGAKRGRGVTDEMADAVEDVTDQVINADARAKRRKNGPA
jgi:hypothetical protein